MFIWFFIFISLKEVIDVKGFRKGLGLRLDIPKSFLAHLSLFYRPLLGGYVLAMFQMNFNNMVQVDD